MIILFKPGFSETYLIKKIDSYKKFFSVQKYTYLHLQSRLHKIEIKNLRWT